MGCCKSETNCQIPVNNGPCGMLHPCPRHAEKRNEIPNLSGELTIFNGVGPDQTIPLNEREIWMIRVSLRGTLMQALNEPGFANGQSKALLIDLVEKIDPKKPLGELPKDHCGCAHGEDLSGHSGSHIHKAPEPELPKERGCGDDDDEGCH